MVGFCIKTQSHSKVQSIIQVRIDICAWANFDESGDILWSPVTFCDLRSQSFLCPAAKAQVNGPKGKCQGSSITHRLAVQASVLLARC